MERQVSSMYNDYYGLRCDPFGKSIREEDHFHSQDFRQMAERLDYLKDVRGIGVFTAHSGMGKSYGLRCFKKQLNPNLGRMEYMCLSTVSVAEFYKTFCDILGVSDKGGKPGRFRAIQEQIYYLYKEKRQPLILAIDEAHHLNTGILNDLKMLMNFKYDSLNCFTLILCGEPHLNHILCKPVHEALRQRITVHYDFRGLNDQEVADYVIHKIERSGGSRSIIAPAALAAVHGYTSGNPRTIDHIMCDAIMIGSQRDCKVIDTETILAAASNQNLG